MISWALLIYLIDVLSTDGKYEGWGILMTISTVAYFGMVLYGSLNGGSYGMFAGQELVLNQNWNGCKAGETITIVRIDGDGTMKLTLPNGETTGWWKTRTIAGLVNTSNSVRHDVLKAPRRLVAWVMVISMLGIAYANFMPKQETAYKMLAAYVGQTVVESPAVKETAGNAIDFLNKAIKKYSDELDTTTKAAEKAAAPKEGAK